MVGELGAFVVEALWTCEHLLERGSVDFVADGLAVDGVPDGGVLDLKGSVAVVVGVKPTGFFYHGFFHDIARTLGVQLGARHCKCFVIDEPVVMAIERRVDSEGEDVLMMCGKHARMDDCAPRDFDTLIDGLGAEDTGGTNFVDYISRLVEHESEDVFVVRDGDDGLNYKLSVPYNSSPSCSVVGVLPADASILLVNAHHILHGRWLSFVIRQDSTEIVDGTKTIAAQLQIVGHHPCASISEVEG